MSLIQLPRRFLAQPQYDAPIHSEWLARGLVVACNPAVGAINQVTQQFATNSGGVGITPTNSGLSWQGAASRYIDFGAGYAAGSIGATIIQVINQGSLVNQFSFSSRAGADMAGIEVLIGGAAVPGRAQARMNPGATIATPDMNGLDDGKDHVLAVRYTPSVELAIWADGINNKQSNASAPASQSTSQNLRLHSRGATYYTGRSGLFLYFDRPLDDADVQALLENPSIIYRAPPRLLWLASSSGEATGSVAYTNADDISEAVATVTATASSATTNADDISDAVAEAEAETVTAAVDVTNADDISAASAKPIIVGQSATTNADDVSAANATPTVTASAANTNSDDISAASAASGSDAEGSVAYTNIDDVSNAVAVPVVTASSASVNADDSSNATLKATITASVAVTNSNDISSAFSGAVVSGSVAVTNADDVSAAAASPVVSGSSATTNADDISDAVAEAEAGEVIASVDVTNANDISAAVAAPVIVGTVTYSNLHDLSAAIAVINFGTIVEAALTTGILQDARIKKPGIPSDAPEWQRTMFEILTGRRGNKITVAPHQTLTFSATPTQAECEALYSYISEVRQSIDQLAKRFDS